MTHAQGAALLRKNFRLATREGLKHPRLAGHTVRSYADFVGSEIERMLAANPGRKPLISVDDAKALAVSLRAGEYDATIAELFNEPF